MKKTYSHVLFTGIMKYIPVKYSLKIYGLVIVLALPFYAQAQTLNWAIQMGINDEGIGTYYSCLASDSAGNVYMAGVLNDSADFDPSAGRAMLAPLVNLPGGPIKSVFLAKYDAQGKYIWAKALSTGGGRVSCLAVDQKGNIIVSGTFPEKVYYNTATNSIDTLSFTSGAAYLTKLDVNGSFKWIKMIEGASIDPYNMAVDRSGIIYLTGVFTDSIDFDPGPGTAILTSVAMPGRNQTNCFFAKYDAEGNYRWAKGIGGNTQGVWGQGIAVDTVGNRNNVYLVGSYRGTGDFDPGTGATNIASNGATDIFFAKYDSSGQYVWAKGIGSATADRGTSLSLGRSGDVCIAGIMALPGPVDFDPGLDTAMLQVTGINDGFIARYDVDGNYVWAKGIGGNNSITQPAQVGRDALENIYVAGHLYNSSPDFDPGADTATVYFGGLGDVFIAKYDACGNYVWAGRMGDYNAAALVANRGISVNADGQVLVAGYWDGGVADFNPGVDTANLTPPVDGIGYYVAKLSFTDTPGIVNYIRASTCEESYRLNGTEYNKSGQYTQIVPGTTRCDSVIILDLSIYPAMAEPVISVDKFTLSVPGTYSTFQWLRNGLFISGATNKSYTVTENGDYRVIVTNETGCSDTSEGYSITNYTGIDDVFTHPNQIHIYPNPSKGSVYIKAPFAVNVKLTDLAGRLFKEERNVTFISIDELPQGIYLLNISNREGVLLKAKKLVKTE